MSDTNYCPGCQLPVFLRDSYGTCGDSACIERVAGADSRPKYDEKYDAPAFGGGDVTMNAEANAVPGQQMREPGLEPGSLAAPDPKAHSSLEDNRPHSEGLRTKQEETGGSPVESTTKSTTGRKPQFFTVPARTRSERCRSCQKVGYWIRTAAGKPLLVDCDVEGGYAPTHEADGQGIAHFATCPQAATWRKR